MKSASVLVAMAFLWEWCTRGYVQSMGHDDLA